MKNLKSGFSLAELLICFAIIAIVATFGFTITKYNIDRAYDRYIYASYRALHDAILEANAQGYEFTADTGYIYNNFINYVAYLLNKDGDQSLKSGSIIKASNGVTYEIINPNCTVVDNEPYCNLEVKIQVPSKKWFDSDKNVYRHRSIYLGYWPQEVYSILIPLKKATATLDTIDVSERIDLLPFYLEDGEVGRFIDNSYKKRTYYSAHGALCTCRDTKPLVAGIGYVCSEGGTTVDATIKPIDPRKLH